MLHNNILGAIEKMQSKVDIKDKKKNNIMHLRRLGLQIPMPLDDNTMVVHTGSNQLISKHNKSNTQFSQDETPLSDLQSQNLAKEFDVDDLLAFAISHKYNLFF
jgi:hypothetical protein